MSGAPECPVSFMHLELRRKDKEEGWKAGESKAWLDYRVVNKIMCRFEGGYTFQGSSLASQR